MLPNVSDVDLDGRTPQRIAPRPRRAAVVRATAVEVHRVDEAAVREAWRIAGGDAHRLRFDSDGSVTVLNASRSA